MTMKQSPGFALNTEKRTRTVPVLLLPSLVIFGIAVLFCFALRGRVVSGLFALANRVLAWLTRLTGTLHLPLSGASDEDVPFVLIPMGILFLWGLTAAVIQKKIWLPILSWLLYVSALGLGLCSPNWALILILGLTLVFHLLRIRGALSWPSAFLLFLCLGLSLSLLPLSGVLPQSRLRNLLSSAWHSLRYDEDSNSMPEGRIQNLSPWNKNGTAALDLIMDVPQKLYLRGFVGETYTGSAWEPLSGDTLSEYGDLFYWLHREGFYSETSIGQAMALTSQEDSSAMTVHNRSACSARAYLPYALSGFSGLDPMALGDASVRAQGRTAAYSYYPGSVPQWYTAQALLAQNQQSNRAYLSLERAYENFVRKQYLQLTPEAAQAARTLFNGDMQGKTLPEIQQAILDRLDQAFTYDESVLTQNGSQDFFQYLTSVSRRGYSVHYATAAALMLRYCGVPARYAEGYFLPTEEAAGFSDGQTISLDETHAHAWAEYYLEGIGWIPFEVTPGYREHEELPAGSASTQRRYENNQLPPPVVEQPDREPNASPALAPARLLLWLLCILLLALLLWELLRRWRLHRALARMEKAPPREAIAQYYAYARYLLAHCPGASAPDPEAALLNQEAIFSPHPMGRAQQTRMRAYAAGTLADCKKHWNLFQRLYYKFILCIY